MIEFKFENDVVSLPTEWEEVTVGMFVNPLFISGDSIGLLSSLSGIGTSKLMNTTEDLMPHFTKVSEFVNKDPQGWRGKEVPTTVTIDGVDVPIPKDLELSRFGQKIMLGQALAKHEVPYQCIPEAIAIYLAPYLYPEDWDEQIEKIAEKVKQLPIVSIFPIADFFLHSMSLYKEGGVIS